ncbi:M91 family zinc metallopeptidase [Nocardia sp. NPDC060259]|uniref:M91 family zinc metallopeptidase n=1 Tax=Nocardia sp. NPDC060259 TaxID=3347088 RepID=UPI00365D78F5
MTLAWNDVKDWNGDSLEAMARAYSQRAASIRLLESVVRRSADIEGWTGAADDAAQQKITSFAAELDRLAGQVEPLNSLALNTITTMEDLRNKAVEIEGLAGTEGFTVSAEGKLHDLWAETGRTEGLSDDEKARRTRVAAQLEVDAAKIITDARALDDENAAALNRAAGDVVVEAPGNQPNISRDNTGIVIETGAGDDTVEVTEDPNTHIATVTVNGKPVEPPLTADQSKNITIKTDAGNDTITVSPGTRVGVKIEGGDGRDTIRGGAGNDTISGGDGDDTITAGDGDNKIEGGKGSDSLAGGSGRDYINGSTGQDLIKGGDGDDVIYGGDDADQIQGEGGNDYLDGGQGGDFVIGGDGNDILSGGLGDDILRGGVGDDKLYAGAGNDDVGDSFGGNDTYYVQRGEDTTMEAGNGGTNTVVDVVLTNIDPDKIKVEGSDEFKERVNADLEFYRSSPTGQQTLEGLSNTEHTVTIKEGTDGQNSANGDWSRATIDPSGKPNVGSDSTITYDPTMVQFGGQYANEPYNNTPPSVILQHEAAHAYDITHGTIRWNSSNPIVYSGDDAVDHGIQEGERVAVGLPIDHDDNPQTPEQRVSDSEHPSQITENALRAELGLPARQHYRPTTR